MNHVEVHHVGVRVNSALVKDKFSLPQEEIDRIVRYVLELKNVFGADCAEVGMNYDDLMNEGRIYAWKAIEKLYDPARGMKLTTFLIMHLKSRFGNLKGKIAKKSHITVTFSEVGAWALADGSRGDQEIERSPFAEASEAVLDLSGGEDAMLSMIDRSNLRSRLSGLKAILFDEYYVQGMTLQEIHSRHPDIQYHKLRRELDILERICGVHCP